MKIPASIIYISIGILFITSCKNYITCPETTDRGDIYYTEHSLETIPYIGKTKVIFKDSNDEELVFKINDFGDTIRHHRFQGVCQTDPGQQIFITYNALNRTVQLRNDSIPASFFITIDIYLTFDDHSEYDNFSISYAEDNSPDYQHFKMLVDKRDITIEQAEDVNKYIAFENQVNVLGKTFNDVSHLKNPDYNYSHLLYYNFEYGVVSFKDFSGKIWVFDRIE